MIPFWLKLALILFATTLTVWGAGFILEKTPLTDKGMFTHLVRAVLLILVIALVGTIIIAMLAFL